VAPQADATTASNQTAARLLRAKDKDDDDESERGGGVSVVVAPGGTSVIVPRGANVTVVGHNVTTADNSTMRHGDAHNNASRPGHHPGSV
jgi:hypothetical protein